MKKMTLKMRLMGGIVAFSMLLGGCAQGFDSDERFTNGVSNTKLEAPVLTAESFSLVLAADGSEAIQVKWPVVMGAGGYRVSVDKVGVMENGSLVDIDPIAVPLKGDQTTVEIDACSVTFPCEYGYQYAVTVQAMANKKLGNSESPLGEPARYLYYTVPTPIPAGADLYEAIQFDPADPTSRAIYVLEPGATYTMSKPIDFCQHNVQIYPADYDAANNVYNMSTNRAIVQMKDIACFETAAGLQIKHVNFDCTELTLEKYSYGSDKASSKWHYALFAGSSGDSYPSLNCVNFGANPKDGAAKNFTYFLNDPIIIENCNFKNVPRAFLGGGYNAWIINDFRINNCIIQVKTVDEDANNVNFISWYKTCGAFEGGFGTNWLGGVRNLSITNSTIYNLFNPNSKVRFMRWGNKNSLKDCFGSNEGSFTMTNCTLYKMYSQAEWGNNTPQDDKYIITVTNNIFVDCARLNKLIGGGGVQKPMNNTGWVATPNGNEGNEMLSKSDVTNGIVVEEDPGFAEPTALDLNDNEFGGQNFKATGAISSTIGDPRWL